MRSRILPTLIAGLGLILAGRVTAQTFNTLHSFTARSVPDYTGTNSDGASPLGELILSSNTLYGAADEGGISGSGTVFAVNTDGTGFTNLHSFTATSGSYPNYSNSDGAGPQAGLLLSGNTLYGTAADGGISGGGTVFAIKADGTGFTNLYDFTASSIDLPFTNSDGRIPQAALILSGNTLYGTAGGGGSSGSGTVFAINTDGTGFTILHTFAASSYVAGYYTNSDGSSPQAQLILSGNTLYGTAMGGGSGGNGTVFKVNTDGTGFTTLYSFTAATCCPNINSDGANPAGLILSGNTLYGTAQLGGSSGNGTVFKVNTDGTGFTNLYSFTETSVYTYGGPPQTNSDGATPEAGLILTNNTLYGTAFRGGSSGSGTVFSLSLAVPPPQLALASDGNGGYFIRVQGTPKLTYRLQRAPSVTGPWAALVTNTAPASGLIEYHETSPPPGAAFYRTVQP